MTTTTNRPVPIADERSAPFFDAARQGRLLIRRCPACARYLAPQRETCDACGSESLEWAPAAGKGKLYSFVVMHQVLHPGFRDEGPYNVAVVELDEGPRMTTNVVGTPASELRVGMPLDVVFEDLGDVAVPKFRARA